MSSPQVLLEARDVGFTFSQRHSFFRHSYHEALKGISFKVFKGQTLGIIGSNGCGKSTLLRLIAGIFRPTVGSIERHSRKISLLSLSLGFDPDLSGTDNAMVSAMFLGARRAEVRKKMPEIVEFSELGDFIHEPIKTYSTGMRARLGFSVAMTMQADLLLIDEVLGVGDARFREKAEKAMLARIDSDQTVILVSHSAPQIERLCHEVIWLKEGRLEQIGKTPEVLEAYDRFNQAPSQ